MFFKDFDTYKLSSQNAQRIPDQCLDWKISNQEVDKDPKLPIEKKLHLNSENNQELLNLKTSQQGLGKEASETTVNISN